MVSTKNRNLWPGSTPEVRYSRTSRLTNLIGSDKTSLIGSDVNQPDVNQPECRWTRPEVAILGADQKERGL